MKKYLVILLLLVPVTVIGSTGLTFSVGDYGHGFEKASGIFGTELNHFLYGAEPNSLYKLWQNFTVIDSVVSSDTGTIYIHGSFSGSFALEFVNSDTTQTPQEVDLIVFMHDISPNPPRCGETLKVRVGIRNGGSGIAPPSHGKLLIDGIGFAIFSVQSIGPHSDVWSPWILLSTLEEGEYILTACADENNEVDETNEQNNCSGKE